MNKRSHMAHVTTEQDLLSGLMPDMRLRKPLIMPSAFICSDAFSEWALLDWLLVNVPSRSAVALWLLLHLVCFNNRLDTGLLGHLFHQILF
jgi:hypothetical protein